MAYNDQYRKESPAEVATKLAYIFNGLKSGIAFDRGDLRFAVGGAAFKNEFDFVSEAAYRIVKKECPSRISPTGVRYVNHIKGTKIEHSIPVSWLVDHMLQLVRRDKSGVSLQSCRSFVDNFAKIALISRKEDEMLRKKGLNSQMPSDWSWNIQAPFARYAYVGIKEHVFNRDGD